MCAWDLENLFDLFKADVNEKISAMKPHSLRWYALKAKAFQYGFDLKTDTDYYEIFGDESVVNASKIVSYTAVVEQTRGLRIKVAHDNGGDLEPLSNAQLDSFVAYMRRVKDAGVKLNITSGVADSLKAAITIIYNPLVLNNLGVRIDGNNATSVQSGISAFLKNLPFNGVFSIQKFEDALLDVEGVSDLLVNSISARYGLIPFANINIRYIPDSGYLRIAVGDLTLTFIAE